MTDRRRLRPGEPRTRDEVRDAVFLCGGGVFAMAAATVQTRFEGDGTTADDRVAGARRGAGEGP